MFEEKLKEIANSGSGQNFETYLWEQRHIDAILQAICSEIEEAMPEKSKSNRLYRANMIQSKDAYNTALEKYKSVLLKRFGGEK